MAINEDVMKKVKQKTENDQQLRSLFEKLLSYESNNNPQYTSQYRSLIEELCPKESE